MIHTHLFNGMILTFFISKLNIVVIIGKLYNLSNKKSNNFTAYWYDLGQITYFKIPYCARTLKRWKTLGFRLECRVNTFSEGDGLSQLCHWLLPLFLSSVNLRFKVWWLQVTMSLSCGIMQYSTRLRIKVSEGDSNAIKETFWFLQIIHWNMLII